MHRSNVLRAGQQLTGAPASACQVIYGGTARHETDAGLILPSKEAFRLAAEDPAAGSS